MSKLSCGGWGSWGVSRLRCVGWDGGVASRLRCVGWEGGVASRLRCVGWEGGGRISSVLRLLGCMGRITPLLHPFVLSLTFRVILVE